METSAKCDLDIISSLIISNSSLKFEGGKYSLIVSFKNNKFVNLGNIG